MQPFPHKSETLPKVTSHSPTETLLSARMASPPIKKLKTSADESNSDTNNTIFICTGTTFKPAAKADLKIRNELPVGTYTIAVSQEGYFLKKIENFKPATGKIYGDLPNQATRILTTFLDRPTSTGILLAGEKGSGKTLLTKQVSLMAQEQSIPTIVVNSALKGEAFNAFLQLIEQPTVMIFDEYEKVRLSIPPSSYSPYHLLILSFVCFAA